MNFRLAKINKSYSLTEIKRGVIISMMVVALVACKSTEEFIDNTITVVNEKAKEIKEQLSPKHNRERKQEKATTINDEVDIASQKNTPKIWSGGTNQSPIKVKIDGFNITLSPNYSYKKKNHFVAETAVHHNLPKLNMYDKQVLATLIFRGECSPEMEMTILVRHRVGLPETTAYKKTGDFSILGLEKGMQALRKALTEQCSNLRVLRVKTSGGILFTDKHTMQAAKNWQIETGFIATEYEKQEGFSIDVNFVNQMRVVYKGFCSDSIVASFIPLKRADYGPNHAGAFFLNKYSEKCPNITRIEVTPSSLPKDFSCESDTKCFYVFEKRENWTMVSSNFTYNAPENYTFSNILTALASKDNNLNEGAMYTVFFVEYVHKVSEMCSALIEQPVRKVMVFEEVNSEFGTRKETGRFKMTIDKRLENKYLAYYNKRKGILFSWAAELSLEYNNQERGFRGAVTFYESNVKIIREHLAKGCGSSDVQATYAGFKNKHL